MSTSIKLTNLERFVLLQANDLAPMQNLAAHRLMKGLHDRLVGDWDWLPMQHSGVIPDAEMAAEYSFAPHEVEHFLLCAGFVLEKCGWHGAKSRPLMGLVEKFEGMLSAGREPERSTDGAT